jgi:hypothetical protein
MKRAMLIFAAGLCLTVPVGPAMGATWVAVTKKCPIGGNKFRTREMRSNSTFGQRPDGRPYSPSPIPPIDECPDNGFVIFNDDFTTKEIARLTALVASSEYQALRATETLHYRAWWLMERLGRDPYQLAARLLTASWESDHDWQRKARYQAQFVRQALALEFTEARRDDWFWLRMRGANALRELGRFVESDAVISSTYVRQRLPTDPAQLAGAGRFAEGLRALNRDRNSFSEPANLIPPHVAVERCGGEGLTPVEIEVCKGKVVRDELVRRSERRSVYARTAAPVIASAEARIAQEIAREVEQAEDYAASSTAQADRR